MISRFSGVDQGQSINEASGLRICAGVEGQPAENNFGNSRMKGFSLLDPLRDATQQLLWTVRPSFMKLALAPRNPPVIQ